jgi:AraC-like DNA-binding protein
MAIGPTEAKVLYFNDIPTKLGQVSQVGVIRNGTGTDRRLLRVFGSYALVYFLEGEGDYSDANGYRHKVIPGDFVLVTPELPHRYCTRQGRYWTEFHIIFSGPVFDLCRRQGILDEGRPIAHHTPVEEWTGRMQSIVTEPTSQSIIEKTSEVSRLLTLLTEVFAGENETESNATADWLSKAKAILDSNLEIDVDPKTIARDLGVSYETFRKNFQKQFGMSPVSYRTRRRMEVACRLLELTTMTHHTIAEHLGFSDEFHFSKRFKQHVGMSPREYRRRTVKYGMQIVAEADDRLDDAAADGE